MEDQNSMETSERLSLSIILLLHGQTTFSVFICDHHK